jgi:nitric oxide reductase activation protein
VYDEIKENGNKYKFTTKFVNQKDVISKNSLADASDKHLFRYITNASRHIAYNGYTYDLSNVQAYLTFLKNIKHEIKIQIDTSPQKKLHLMDIAIAIDYMAKYIADL